MSIVGKPRGPRERPRGGPWMTKSRPKMKGTFQVRANPDYGPRSLPVEVQARCLHQVAVTHTHSQTHRVDMNNLLI